MEYSEKNTQIKEFLMKYLGNWNSEFCLLKRLSEPCSLLKANVTFLLAIINDVWWRISVCLHRLWLYSHEFWVVSFPKFLIILCFCQLILTIIASKCKRDNIYSIIFLIAFGCLLFLSNTSRQMKTNYVIWNPSINFACEAFLFCFLPQSFSFICLLLSDWKEISIH